MTERQLDNWTDYFVETYGFSGQLTRAWLKDHGKRFRLLEPSEMEELRRFAKV